MGSWRAYEAYERICIFHTTNHHTYNSLIFLVLISIAKILDRIWSDKKSKKLKILAYSIWSPVAFDFWETGICIFGKVRRPRCYDVNLWREAPPDSVQNGLWIDKCNEVIIKSSFLNRNIASPTSTPSWSGAFQILSFNMTFQTETN